MVLTKSELITASRAEVRIVLRLAGKVDTAQLLADVPDEKVRAPFTDFDGTPTTVDARFVTLVA